MTQRVALKVRGGGGIGGGEGERKMSKGENS